MKPVVLLIPGMLNDASLWDDVVAGLADVAELRIADVTTQDSLPALADSVEQSLADLDVDHPVVLAGFSLGGYVAIELLARAPRRWRAAVLISTSARPEDERALAARTQAIAAFEQDFARSVEGIVGYGTCEATPELRARLTRMMLAVGAPTAIRQTRAIMSRLDRRAELAALDIPVRVLCGSADRITPAVLSQELAGLIPQAQLQQVEGAGHMLPCENPTAVVQTLRALLADLSTQDFTR